MLCARLDGQQVVEIRPQICKQIAAFSDRIAFPHVFTNHASGRETALFHASLTRKSANLLLQRFQEAGGMGTIHLHMMELEGDGQGCSPKASPILSPHHHRIAKQIGVLIHDAVQLRLDHGRGAYHHRLLPERTLTGRCHLGRQLRIVRIELPQIFREQDVARVDAPLPIRHDHIDRQPVITHQLTALRQQVELLHAAMHQQSSMLNG